jgi:hypothetical protein
MKPSPWIVLLASLCVIWWIAFGWHFVFWALVILFMKRIGVALVLIGAIALWAKMVSSENAPPEKVPQPQPKPLARLAKAERDIHLGRKEQSIPNERREAK